MPIVHVIGAGLAGLSAAVRLAERRLTVRVYEAAPQAGGRCRSYHDPALDMEIDNGNHLVLSGNKATLAYLATIGAGERLVGPPFAEFPFVDLATGDRWTLCFNDGVLPSWIFDPKARVPDTRPLDYLALAPLLWATKQTAVENAITCSGVLYERLVRPLLLAALNTEPREASAGLAGAVVRETLVAGGRACRPLVARDGLGPTFVDPAIAWLRGRGAIVQLNRRLREFEFDGRRVRALQFGHERIVLGADDSVVLAVPPIVAAGIVPQLNPPSEFRAIVNAHFRVRPPAGFPPILGVLNGTVEWIFAFGDRMAVTISAADRLLDEPRERLAATIWHEVAAAAGLPRALPPWRVVRERRATIAATPAQNAKRPRTRTAYANLVLAGDWTDTGLPATIEGAIRSGNRAADALHK